MLRGIFNWCEIRTVEPYRFFLIWTLCYSALSLGCATGHDYSEFPQEYAQNKARYDRILKSWDQTIASDSKVIFQEDGVIKMVGNIGERFTRNCGASTFPFLLGEREDRPDIKVVSDAIVVPCEGKDQKIYANWHADGRFELSFGETSMSSIFLQPSLVQPKSQKASTENKSNCQYSGAGKALLQKFQSKIAKGKFGGGYGKIKWGMCMEEVAALYPDYRQESEKLVLKDGEFETTVSFHEGLAYYVSVKDDADYNEQTRDGVVKILTSKYGRPKVVDRLQRKEFAKNGNLFVWTNQTNVFSDGFTEIFADTCKTIGKGFMEIAGREIGYCVLADTYERGVIYRSKLISDEIVKLDKDLKRKAEREKSKKY